MAPEVRKYPAAKRAREFGPLKAQATLYALRHWHLLHPYWTESIASDGTVNDSASTYCKRCSMPVSINIFDGTIVGLATEVDCNPPSTWLQRVLRILWPRRYP